MTPRAFLILSVLLAPFALAAVLGLWRGACFLWRLHTTRRNRRAWEREMRDAETDELIGRGMRSAERFGLLTKDFK